MDYIFLDALKTEKFYKKSSHYLSYELVKIRDMKLIYNDIHKAYDIDLYEKKLISILDKLEGRKTWIRILLSIISFFAVLQFFSVIYVAFIQNYLNSDQVNLMVLSAIISTVSISALVFEHQKFKKNKYEALKLFLIVKNHNHLAIIKEREAALNPRMSYKKGSPMDYIFGSDDD